MLLVGQQEGHLASDEVLAWWGQGAIGLHMVQPMPLPLPPHHLLIQ